MIEQVNGIGRDGRSHTVAKLPQSTLHFTTRGLMATGGLTGVEGGGDDEEKREFELGGQGGQTIQSGTIGIWILSSLLKREYSDLLGWFDTNQGIKIFIVLLLALKCILN